MTTSPKDRAGAGWLALPVVCFAGDTALLALAAGTLAAGAVAAADISLVTSAAFAVLLRPRKRT